MGRHRAFLARRHAGDAQTAGPGRGCGVCGGDKGSVTSPQDETSADVRTRVHANLARDNYLAFLAIKTEESQMAFTTGGSALQLGG